MCHLASEDFTNLKYLKLNDLLCFCFISFKDVGNDNPEIERPLTPIEVN